MDKDLDHLLVKMVAAARRAGSFIRNRANRLESAQIETKGVHDLVTYVDREAERMLVEDLKDLLPEAAFFTEEKTVARSQAPWQWVIDPLDGTTNFIHGIPVFSVSLALIHYQKPIAAVVYEIVRDDCFEARKGGGTRLNGKPVSVSERSRLSDSLLATGFPYHDYSRMEAFINMFRWCMLNSRGLRRLGSAAVDLAYVACGRFDGFFEYGLNPWDVAAGVLLVEEAGGKVSDYRGGDNAIFGREVLAANPLIYPALLRRTREIHQD